tara:strand:- start:370 stop:1038 length:669 start_codon:yes stop_codon:yes gene_type:complete
MTTRLKIRALHVQGSPSVEFLCKTCVLTNNINSNWSGEQAYGKMDPIPFYSSTTRTLQVTFETEEYLEQNYTSRKMQRQISRLIKFQYPRYVENSGLRTIASPPFFSILHEEVDNGEKYRIYERVKGYINGELNITPGHAEEHSVDYEPDRTLAESYFRVSFSFIVLHTQQPGWVGRRFGGDKIYSTDRTLRPAQPLIPARRDTDATLDEARQRRRDTEIIQ